MRKNNLNGLLGAWVIMLALVFVPALGSTERSTTREIEVSAKQFGYTPNIIRVKQGDRVVINLNTTDVMHGFYLEGYGINLKTWAGHQDTAEFIAAKIGKFRFRCSETCGPLHPFMIGELIVEPNNYYRISAVLTLMTAAGALSYVWRRKESKLI